MTARSLPLPPGGPSGLVSAETPNLAQQVAGLAWRASPTGFDVLLVTSRTSRHWLLPKGWPVKGKSLADSAAQEAFEEAGVCGNTGEKPIGTYLYGKVLADGAILPCTVDVFAIRTTALLEHWPEMAQRSRRWYTAAAAAGQVVEQDLARLLLECEGLIHGSQ